ncbi:nuclease-related domain-containing protein [uncultured Desulfobacter sp.]|uniref:nuclease-related domain-containing protein n=1 Tax=uncultured Desulfobacter sp. TaxID=240139 RepID=UPI002AAABB98|nr:nuclease-related domain-containing protein [uncultured Desulfobacter sp.]
MMLFLSSQIVLPIIVLGILFVFVSIYRFVELRKKRRSPFTDAALLRLPGHSLNNQIEELSENLNLYIFGIFFSALVFTQIVVLLSELKGVAPYPSKFPLHYCMLIIIIGVLLYKIAKCLTYRNRLRLGYEGELVTAQELHHLMPEGNYVYHDFPAGNFNIDHVVVGPAGVFAVETKTRSKRTSGDKIKEASAEYNGKEIVFPEFRDKSYLDQAQRQAKWLSKWLTSATGEHVEVFPVVSLPGWYIERKTGYNGTFVVNPKQLKSVILSKSNHRIDSKKIQQINHQLEAKCRDIEIKSKQYDK